MKRFICVNFAIVLCAVTVTATYAELIATRLMDGGEVLNANEEAEILAKLDTISSCENMGK